MSTSDQSVQTQVAGLFLLARSFLDGRLPWLANQQRYPDTTHAKPVAPLLAAIGIRWAGLAQQEHEQLDPGLCVLSGLPQGATWSALRQSWMQAAAADHAQFQANFLTILAGQRLVGGDVLTIHQVPVAGQQALVAGVLGGQVWPLGGCFDNEHEATALLNRWSNAWAAVIGTPPTFMMDQTLAARVTAAGAGLDAALSPYIRAVDPSTVDLEAVDPFDADADSASYVETDRELRAALARLDSGQLGLPAADLTIGLSAISLLRLWARWLRQFAASSPAYLLDNFVLRPGRVRQLEQRIVVEIPPQTLDIVLEMVDYLTPLERLPWLNNSTIEFMFRDDTL
ncbi:MAG: hypothetical protein R2911_10605 [Caldilineaceae bacterium]